jgi:hypothetical protein
VAAKTCAVTSSNMTASRRRIQAGGVIVRTYHSLGSGDNGSTTNRGVGVRRYVRRNACSYRKRRQAGMVARDVGGRRRGNENSGEKYQA